MSYGADWICECGWANLDVRKRCRNCGKEIDWKARAESLRSELYLSNNGKDNLAQNVFRLEAELEAVKQEAVEVMKPFAEAAGIRLCGEWGDDERFGQTDVAFYLKFGHLRAARAFVEKHGRDG